MVTYDNNFRLQKITRFAEINNDYGPGSNGNPPTPPSLGQFTSYGPVWARRHTTTMIISITFIEPAFRKLII
ncbi:MAG: hypothetical protein WKF59_00880 [Chitinophagaceae bacterium]